MCVAFLACSAKLPTTADRAIFGNIPTSQRKETMCWVYIATAVPLIQGASTLSMRAEVAINFYDDI